MTTVLPPDSHRRVHAMKLGRHLTAVMAARRISKRGLAETLSTSRSLLILWCKGDVLPSLDQARELAEALSDPAILQIVMAGRMLTCPVCSRTFEWRGGGRATYCSDRCRKYGANAANRRRSNLPMVEAELAIFKDSVTGFCAACEPDGICKTPACQLRPVSPLPLIGDGRLVARAVKADGAWGNAANRENQLVAIRAANARRWTPEERVAQALATRRRWEALTPEQRAERGRLISKRRRSA